MILGKKKGFIRLGTCYSYIFVSSYSNTILIYDIIDTVMVFSDFKFLIKIARVSIPTLEPSYMTFWATASLINFKTSFYLSLKKFQSWIVPELLKEV